ncbi:NAD(P)/FAD-dependent oxidoreductase [Joostella atrarenae]|uniref:NAD(P)/FAD-dependent oxidoreductase n=1 Tax=Joostella atrarenae TaxID=679257 RepID=UPI001F1EC955|nr:NAD(P)/FAD-dependent oxidoreductase [Joostella atrarenae]
MRKIVGTQIYDVIIIGGGLAGLTAAIHLSKLNYNVLVFEKNTFPHHKVCGEYVSNEILPYLEYLNVSIKNMETKTIERLQITTENGSGIETKLPLGGIGISRYAFDDLLYKKAISNNVDFLFEVVKSVTFNSNTFQVTTKSGTYNSKIAIGAYGKRDYLDKQLDRSFINKKSSWLGIKAHYKYDVFPDDLVALHSFKGGYGGLSKTETGAVNFCYLTTYKSFKCVNGVEEFNKDIVSKNKNLATFLKDAEPIFEHPMSIAQISFSEKESVYNHILMCGDTAGLIHPLCGNGMAMAIHSAKIASELIDIFFKNNSFNRNELERSYQKEWNKQFKSRLWMGRQLQKILLNNHIAPASMKLITNSPWLLNKMIKQTHGKPIL